MFPHSTHCVVTSINGPTPAMHTWNAALPTLVVPDLKTPVCEYEHSAIEILESAPHNVMTTLPENHYAQKNRGYLEVMARGAEYILDTDDDTFFDERMVGQPFVNSCEVISSPLSEFVNIYAHRLGDFNFWPRGLPPRLWRDRSTTSAGASRSSQLPAVTQFLIDGDTDVDAVQRLVFGDRKVEFPKTRRLDIVKAGYVGPFNSQLTLWRKDVFELMYIPTTVDFRFCDILRGIVAKRVMDRHGFDFGYADSCGWQERNPHDYSQDFAGEISCYLQVESAWNELRDLGGNSPIASLQACYERLISVGICEATELEPLAEWVGQIKTAAVEK